jgi:hypothetical protein
MESNKVNLMTSVLLLNSVLSITFVFMFLLVIVSWIVSSICVHNIK